MSEGEGLLSALGMNCPEFLFYATNLLACQFHFHCSGYGYQCISKTQLNRTKRMERYYCQQ